MFFSSENTGWTVGNQGTILKTEDAGSNWTSQTSGTSSNLNGVCFTDANRGVVAGDLGTILATTDGGATWSERLLFRPHHYLGRGWSPDQPGNGMKSSLESSSHNRDLNKYSDREGGSRQISPNLQSVFADGSEIWAVGDSGTILYSADSGDTWSSQTSGVTTTLYVLSIQPQDGSLEKTASCYVR